MLTALDSSSLAVITDKNSSLIADIPGHLLANFVNARFCMNMPEWQTQGVETQASPLQKQGR
jgi:hypothetical protein